MKIGTKERRSESHEEDNGRREANLKQNEKRRKMKLNENPKFNHSMNQCNQVVGLRLRRNRGG